MNTNCRGLVGALVDDYGAVAFIICIIIIIIIIYHLYIQDLT
jgi:hypothetical protein